ncbi:MAG: retroviral-like aspartic protease [Planctomycetes bacterium]|nr:retroviral-like aspartic protease [Planctomycetota bacterium]
MGRVFGTIQVDGKQCRTLFDSGAKNSYIVPGAAEGMARTHLPEPRPTGLGGRVRQTEEACLLVGKLEGKRIKVDAYVLDEIGRDDDGQPIEILLGALAMQKWNIRLIPQEERLDLSRYPEEFIEFAE